MQTKLFAAMTGLSESKIRFYEKQGLLKTGRLTNGYRDFAPEDAFRSNAFRLLMRYGFTIEEAVSMLDEQQDIETFEASLRERRDDLQHQADLLQARMDRIDKALGLMNLAPGAEFQMVDQPDFLFIRASYGRDFSVSAKHAREIARFYELLTVTYCSRIIEKDDLEGPGDTVDPSYIIAINERKAGRLDEVTRERAERLCMGKCICWRRKANREESAQKHHFEPLWDYLDAHGYRLRSDVLLIPEFLNLDGNGKDIETLFVPVR